MDVQIRLLTDTMWGSREGITEAKLQLADHVVFEYAFAKPIVDTIDRMLMGEAVQQGVINGVDLRPVCRQIQDDPCWYEVWQRGVGMDIIVRRRLIDIIRGNA